MTRSADVAVLTELAKRLERLQGKRRVLRRELAHLDESVKETKKAVREVQQSLAPSVEKQADDVTKSARAAVKAQIEKNGQELAETNLPAKNGSLMPSGGTIALNTLVPEDEWPPKGLGPSRRKKVAK